MYTALASVYDLFGENDDAARAAYYAAFLPRGGDGMDLGCGTGGFTVQLALRGFTVYGADSSPDMLRRAAARNSGLRFVQGDAARPPVPHPLDFITAANDVYNYVKDLDRAFKSAYAALRPGGVLAFDISSAYKLTEVLAGRTFSETKQDTTYVWQNFKSGNKLFIDFTVFSPEGETYIKTCETQVQYIRTNEAVTAALYKAGFSSVKAYAFGKKTKPRPNTQKILFAAEK